MNDRNQWTGAEIHQVVQKLKTCTQTVARKLTLMGLNHRQCWKGEAELRFVFFSVIIPWRCCTSWFAGTGFVQKKIESDIRVNFIQLLCHAHSAT